MRMEYAFTVAVPVPGAWAVLLDVERVAPCVPGAALTRFDGEAFEGTVKVKLGPVSLTYLGRGRFVERDETDHRVVIEASGRDSRGAGTASATVTAHLRPAEEPGATRVTTVVDLAVTGRPAQFGRGMIAEVGGKLIDQFAQCLAVRLAEAPKEAVAAPAPVDLVAVGAGPVLRRIAPYVVGFVLGALVTSAVFVLLNLP